MVILQLPNVGSLIRQFFLNQKPLEVVTIGIGDGVFELSPEVHIKIYVYSLADVLFVCTGLLKLTLELRSKIAAVHQLFINLLLCRLVNLLDVTQVNWEGYLYLEMMWFHIVDK